MRGKTHAVVAGLWGAVIAAKFGYSPAYVLTAIAGGLFPDTDCRNSIMGRWVPMWLFFKPHRRNLTHSFMGMFIFSMIISIWWPINGFFFGVGYFTHLLLDMLNKSGVPLFYPARAMVSVARFKVGGIMELFVIVGFYIIIMGVMTFI